MLYERYLEQSNLPLRYRKSIPLYPEEVDAAAFERLNQIRQDIQNFVSQGQNVLICSNYVGNGKTTWASKLLLEFLQKVENSYYSSPPGLFINVTSFLNEKRLAISDNQLLEKVQQLEKQILTSKLVIFDDLGVRDLTPYDSNNLYYWIDYRTANNKSCIFTSNLLPEQLIEGLDPRLYDRIVNYSEIVIIRGGSNRGLTFGEKV